MADEQLSLGEPKRKIRNGWYVFDTMAAKGRLYVSGPWPTLTEAIRERESEDNADDLSLIERTGNSWRLV